VTGLSRLVPELSGREPFLWTNYASAISAHLHRAERDAFARDRNGNVDLLRLPDEKGSRRRRPKTDALDTDRVRTGERSREIEAATIFGASSPWDDRPKCQRK
jgi:hypothetical protein